ncbi:hypothetical protein PENSPDRAFT_380587 [Peniophora sp. CONT]|nr:hypothetical protein PENSPDRAFT_380587 [Peniophora sp. CONT]
MDPSGFPGGHQYHPSMGYTYQSTSQPGQPGQPGQPAQQPQAVPQSHQRWLNDDRQTFDQRYMQEILYAPQPQPQLRSHSWQPHPQSGAYLPPPQSQPMWSEPHASSANLPSVAQYMQQQHLASRQHVPSHQHQHPVPHPHTAPHQHAPHGRSVPELEIPSIRRRSSHSAAPAPSAAPSSSAASERAPVPLRQRAQRTGQACESCRGRKTKCSGTRPVCERCQTRGLPCRYPESKAQARRRGDATTTSDVPPTPTSTIAPSPSSSSSPRGSGSKVPSFPDNDGQVVHVSDSNHENSLRVGDQDTTQELPTGSTVPSMSALDDGLVQHSMDYGGRPGSSEGIPLSSTQWPGQTSSLPHYFRDDEDVAIRDLLDPRVIQALPSTPLSAVSAPSAQTSQPPSQYFSPSSVSAYSPGTSASHPRSRATSLPYVYGPEGVYQDNSPQSQWLAGELPQNIKRVDVRTHAQPQPYPPQYALLPRLFDERRSSQKPDV